MDSAASVSRVRASLLPAAVAVLTLIFAAIATTDCANASEEAERFIQQGMDASFAIVNDTALSEEERSVAFRDFMQTVSDLRRIAVFTLGDYADQVNPEDIDAFVDAFTTYTAAIYLNQLEAFRGRTATVLGSMDRAADDFVVIAEVVDPNNAATPVVQVSFRVRASGNSRLIITDMYVGGVWLAITQRADFTSYLGRNDGALAPLTEFLIQAASAIQTP